MTRDEVMALTDEELRMRAAELAGFTWFLSRRNDGCRFMAREGDGFALYATSGDKVCGDSLRFVPYYPHDTAAAWGLWRSLPVPRTLTEDAFWVEMSFGIPRDDGADGFLRISKRGDEDIPRAITRAFVLAMTQEAA
ncbi:MAG: hypothetical protein WC763_07030 [Candidatus Paceibacterota bacterium]|jgi:hypothetical protein